MNVFVFQICESGSDSPPLVSFKYMPNSTRTLPTLLLFYVLTARNLTQQTPSYFKVFFFISIFLVIFFISNSQLFQLLAVIFISPAFVCVCVWPIVVMAFNSVLQTFCFINRSVFALQHTQQRESPMYDIAWEREAFRVCGLYYCYSCYF